MNNKILGKIGENIAVTFLQHKGYRILYRNWHCSFGEIDIVAQEKDFVAFVEIKTRTNLDFGPPYSAVNDIKQARLIKLAQVFLKRYGMTDSPCRIDVISISVGKNNKVADIELIKDAFWER